MKHKPKLREIRRQTIMRSKKMMTKSVDRGAAGQIKVSHKTVAKKDGN